MDSADTTPFDHHVSVPLDIIYLEIKSVSKGNSSDNDDDIDDLSVIQYIATRDGGKSHKGFCSQMSQHWTTKKGCT